MAGVPRSSSFTEYMIASPSFALRFWRSDSKVLREVIQRAQHGIRSQPAHRAERTRDQRVAQVAQQRHLRLALPARRGTANAVDHLHAARRADAAGRALAARLDGAELHRIAGH